MFARFVIEIRTQKIAGVVCKNGISADYILPVRVFPLKMAVYILILQRFEQSVRAFRTLIFFLIA